MVGTCAQGEVRCVDGAQRCVQLGPAIEETRIGDFDYTLCDTLDNDCDGRVDEGETCLGQHRYEVDLTPRDPIMGDRDFKGHGPKVTVNVRHQLAHDGLWVEICAEFAETESDYSTGRACLMHPVPGPAGRSIAMVLSSDAKIVYVDRDHARDVVLSTSGASTESFVEFQPGDLESVSCVGDTDGDDIGGGTGCAVAGVVRYRVQPEPH